MNLYKMDLFIDVPNEFNYVMSMTDFVNPYLITEIYKCDGRRYVKYRGGYVDELYRVHTINRGERPIYLTEEQLDTMNVHIVKG